MSINVTAQLFLSVLIRFFCLFFAVFLAVLKIATSSFVLMSSGAMVDFDLQVVIVAELPQHVREYITDPTVASFFLVPRFFYQLINSNFVTRAENRVCAK